MSSSSDENGNQGGARARARAIACLDLFPNDPVLPPPINDPLQIPYPLPNPPPDPIPHHHLPAVPNLLNNNLGIPDDDPPPRVPVALQMYVDIQGFPVYPIDHGNQNNVSRLFTKTLTPSDVRHDLQIVGPNRDKFVMDVINQLDVIANQQRVTATDNYNVELNIFHGNVTSNGSVKLKLLNGNIVSLGWHSFLAQHNIQVQQHQKLFGWSRWEPVEGQRHNLTLTIQLL